MNRQVKKQNKRLVQQTKLLLKGQTADWIQIWKCFDESDQTENNTYYFCLKIFQMLINSQKKVDFTDNHEAMLSTLLVLEFFKNTKKKQERLISQSKKLFSQNHMKLYGHAEWVVDLFLKNSQQSSFAQQFISRLCHAPKKISWKVEPGRQFQDALQSAQIYCRQLEANKNKQEKHYKCLKNTSFSPSFIESKILSFGYICFLSYVQSSNYEILKQIYLHILDILKGFIHSFRVTNRTYEVMINFLFLIKSILTFYSCNYDDILKQMVELMNIVRNFPGVLGHFGQQLFQIAHGQLKCKGTAFRKKIKMEYPTIDIKNANQNTLSKKILFLNNGYSIYGKPECLTLTNLRKLVIHNTLACCDPQNAAKNWKSLKTAEAQNTFNIYYKISKIVNLTLSLQSYSQIKTMQVESITQLFKYTIMDQRKIKKPQEQELNDMINQENKLGIFPFPIPEIVNISTQQFEKKNHTFSFFQAMQSCKVVSSDLFYQNKASVILLGDDYQVGVWIKQICKVIEETPLEMHKKLEIFLLPSKRFTSSIAQYISTKDLWYRRFVYNVFRQKVLFPDIQIDEMKGEKSKELKDFFPNFLLNKSLHMYIRQAQRIFPIQIFKIILKLKEMQQPQTIYFSSSVLIGTSAQIEILRNNNEKIKKNLSNDFMDFYMEKIKKPISLVLDMQINYRESIDLKQTVKRRQTKIAVEDIQICNTPREYFLGDIPDPSDSFIEVSILTEKMGKTFKKQVQNKETFKRNNQHEVKQAFKDLFINMSANFIAIESQEPMKIIVDGAATNKVQKIMIMPATNKDEYPIKLPIKTFLPFQS